MSCESVTTDPPGINDGVTVRLIVDGPGRITSGAAISCVDNCTWTLPASEDVALRAAPSAGNVFVAWEGDCDTLPQRCERTFRDGDTVTAHFAPHALRLRVFGDGEGAMAIQGPGINTTCDADCGVGLSESLQLAITVFGSEGTTLGAWSGDCGDAPAEDYCLVLVSGSTDVRKRWVHPPVAVDDPNYVVEWETTLVVPAADGVLQNDEDTEGDDLTAVLFANVSNGTLDLAADGGFPYVPDKGFVGNTTISYFAFDGELESDVATVTITVTPPQAPDDP